MRGLVCIAVVVALASPAPAEACSCGRFDEVTPATCRGAKRVFAGTVARYRWPTAYDEAIGLARRRPVEVELAVDRVWTGEVPSSVVATTGYGGGDCGIHPIPGTRFVVCDDESGDAPPSFQFCAGPAFDAPALEAALGTAHSPSRSGWGPRRSWWREPVLGPVFVVAVFALLGRRARQPSRDAPLRYRWLILALVACAGLTVGIRAIAAAARLPALAGLGPVTLGAGLGAVVGFRGQRQPQLFAGRFGALAVALAFAALPVVLGYAPLHLPWNQQGAVDCSRRRAEQLLASDEPLDEALARAPHACIDGGMARYRRARDRCLAFPDGEGSEWYVCRDDGVTTTFIGPESPP